MQAWLAPLQAFPTQETQLSGVIKLTVRSAEIRTRRCTTGKKAQPVTHAPAVLVAMVRTWAIFCCDQSLQQARLNTVTCCSSANFNHVPHDTKLLGVLKCAA